MAYNEFAYFYDEFNGEADYDALYAHIHAKLKEHGIHDGILADLGCGTGELTLMLTQAGYDMIGIDQSEEMLCVVRDKAEQLGLSGRLLLLRQDLLKLDLYGATTTMPPTAAWRSPWTSTTTRPASTSTSSSASTPMTLTPSAPRWKSTALRWKASATARPSAR